MSGSWEDGTVVMQGVNFSMEENKRADVEDCINNGKQRLDHLLFVTSVGYICCHGVGRLVTPD